MNKRLGNDKPYERGAVGRVYNTMKDGRWHNASSIRWAAASPGAIHPASEGLRRMRELRQHGFYIDKRHDSDSLHYQYRLRKPNSKPRYDQNL